MVHHQCNADESQEVCSGLIHPLHIKSSPDIFVHERLDHAAPNSPVHQVAKQILHSLEKGLQACDRVWDCTVLPKSLTSSIRTEAAASDSHFGGTVVTATVFLTIVPKLQPLCTTDCSLCTTKHKIYVPPDCSAQILDSVLSNTRSNS